MYSLNDMTNGFKKIEPQVEIPSNGTSNQIVSTGEVPVAKEETKDATCSMVGHKLSPLPPKSGYPETSLGEISNQNDVMNIKISNIQGASSFQNGFKDKTLKTGDQIENQLNKLPSSDAFQSSFDYSIQENMPIAQEYRDGQLAKHSIVQKEMYPEGTELRSPINQSSFHPLPVYQMSINRTMPSDQFDAQNDSPKIGSSCHEQMDVNVVAPPNMSSHKYEFTQYTQYTVPLHHIDTQEEPTSPQIEDIQKDTRYQAPKNQPEIMFLHDGYYSNESLNVPKFNEKQIYDAGPNRDRSASYQCCQCCCHSPTQNEPNYVPPLSLENQRPSVIMVPVSWSNISSGTSHVPFKVNTPYSLPSQHGVVNSPYSLPLQNRPNVTSGLGYRNDCDSSDEDDDERQEKYFRLNIDGTTARFKLTRAEWERIPINTFPSGGRLLSGDWTRIFLEKVKESNPWCSLRFKNNHVRSENSRKIHSAVFFRGGAECKRPECNVKVRFVIQKEKGKYVDVTYVGNVCHSSQPDGGGRNRNRIRGIVF